MTPEEQAAADLAAAAQAPEAPAQVAAPVAAAVGDGPWANDINLIFEEAQRPKVDEFLRTKIQPYVTRLEQDAAQSRDARELVNALNENPADAYVMITEQLYGEQAANDLLTYMQTQLNEREQAQQTPANQQQAAPLDPRVEQLLNQYELEQQEKQYDATMAQIVAENPDINADLLHPFVAASEGDWNKAISMYRGAAAVFQGGNQAPPATPAPGAPPVMGSAAGTVAPSTVETTKQYSPGMTGMNEAIDDFMKEIRSNPAPPVV